LVITLTGGEPFLHQSVYDLADYLDGLPCSHELNFISNGTVLPDTERLRRLRKLTRLYISLESHLAPVNDSIRGTGALAAARKNIRLVTGYGLPTGVMTTLMNKNIGSLTAGFEDFVTFVARLPGNEIIFERFVPVGQASPFKDEVVPERIYSTFLETLAGYCRVEFQDIRGFKAFKLVLNENTVDIMGAPCTSGKDGAALLCDATVYPCRRLPVRLGNLLEDDLAELIPGDDIRQTCALGANTDYLDCWAISESLREG
ncbi:MAG: hypothetical protein QGH40_04890, partial [bacterium]|nr:hypothetical protein [bacterium]